MSETGKDFTERLRHFWQRRSCRDLTTEDAREMAANLSGFFRLLAVWDCKARREAERPQSEEEAYK